ncbi:hypothetical protein [Hyperthermus butylicus]|uniref:Uncharacterized protein n=1 Tax=Hyperthermus butylicus (strain DSM 5456 / JCM 9403 / PLM1-5) TaxID=415426 RepID=A2BMM0_HYPBU|nr:hypothetical protein [Hyperthermus butylicus]ABM81231.1 hypothetical protein Hbut_1407 [Hyperthermus butylicus DSM 5456]
MPKLTRPTRGISGTIAAIIIITFLISVLIPFIIYLHASSNVTHSRLVSTLFEKARTAIPKLDISVTVSGGTKTYTLTNKDSRLHIVYLLIVRDDNGYIHLVKAGNCTLGCGISGSTRFKVSPSPSSWILNYGGIAIKPGEYVKVIITNGELLGIFLVEGSYIPVLKLAESQTTYAEVAGAVQAYYLIFVNYTSLDDLLQNPDIAVTTNLAEPKKSQDTIADSGITRALCATDKGYHTIETNDDIGYWALGAYKYSGEKVYDLVYIDSMMPFAGSFVLGGMGGSYTESKYSISLLYAGYTWIPWRPSFTDDGVHLGTIVAKKPDGSWELCFTGLYVGGDNNVYMKNVCPLGSTGSLTSLLAKAPVETSYYNIGAENEELSFTIERAILDLNGVGLFVRGIDQEGWPISIWCPPENKTSWNGVVFRGSGCWLARLKVEGSATSQWRVTYVMKVYDLNVTLGSDYVNRTGVIIDSTGYGTAGDLVVVASPIIDDESNDISGLTPYPFRVKLAAQKAHFLELYDYRTSGWLNDTKAFGFYYYAGFYYVEGYSGLYGAVSGPKGNNYVIGTLYAKDVKVLLYEFQVDETGGLDPYIAFVDVDTNGLTELVFMTEETGIGWDYTYDDIVGYATSIYRSMYRLPDGTILSDFNARGCIDYTTATIYVVFIGYEVNGSEVAQVSMQLRYYFHDNSGSDTGDVDDPRKGLFGVYLINSTGYVFSSREYIYQELDDVEDTWPPNTNFLTDAVYLAVPDRNETFYVVLGFNDPYVSELETNGWTAYNTINDMDFTVAIEWTSLWFLHR